MLSKVGLLKSMIGKPADVRFIGPTVHIWNNPRGASKITAVGEDVFETTDAKGNKVYFAIDFVSEIKP